MNGEHRPVPFRWILPVAQLLLCVAILWLFRHGLVYEIRASLNAYFPHDTATDNSPVPPPNLDPYLPSNALRDAPANPYEDDMTDLRLEETSLLNLPASLVDLSYAIAAPGKEAWIPREMSLSHWRAISWPVLGLVFWWLAGRGVEALIAALRGVVRPALTYVETAIALLFSFIGIAFCLESLLDRSPHHGEVPWILLCLAGTLWFGLGTATIVARIAQWRIRRRIARQPDAAPSPA
jgi:hypothetical protein